MERSREDGVFLFSCCRRPQEILKKERTRPRPHSSPQPNAPHTCASKCACCQSTSMSRPRQHDKMRPLLALLCAQASAAALHPSPRPHAARCCHRARVAATAAAAPETCEVLEANLLRLCALTDRGQRASPEQESELRAAIAALEAVAPPADALDINGEWRLLAACGETTYRSSPFFWAFRQAKQGESMLLGTLHAPSMTFPAGDRPLDESGRAEGRGCWRAARLRGARRDGQHSILRHRVGGAADRRRLLRGPRPLPRRASNPVRTFSEPSGRSGAAPCPRRTQTAQATARAARRSPRTGPRRRSPTARARSSRRSSCSFTAGAHISVE